MLLLGTDLPFDVSKPEQKNLPPMVMACEFAPELNYRRFISTTRLHLKLWTIWLNLGISASLKSRVHNSCTPCQFRHQGYQQALRRAGSRWIRLTTTYGDFTFWVGPVAVRQLLSLPDAPTRSSVTTTLWQLVPFRKLSDWFAFCSQDLSVIRIRWYSSSRNAAIHRWQRFLNLAVSWSSSYVDDLELLRKVMITSGFSFG